MSYKKIRAFMLAIACVGCVSAHGGGHGDGHDASLLATMFTPKKVIGTLAAGAFGPSAAHTINNAGLYSKIKNWCNAMFAINHKKSVQKEVTKVPLPVILIYCCE